MTSDILLYSCNVKNTQKKFVSKVNEFINKVEVNMLKKSLEYKLKEKHINTI